MTPETTTTAGTSGTVVTPEGPVSTGGPASTNTFESHDDSDSERIASGSAVPQPPPVPPRRLPSPIRPSAFGAQDALILVAAAMSSLCLVWVIFYQLTSLSGGVGFLVCWYVGFVALTWIATAQIIERQVATDRVVAVIVVSAALLIVAIVVFIVVWVCYKAIPSIHWGSLFTKDQKSFVVTDPNALNQVGVVHAIIGTFEQVLMAVLIGVPFAIATAVYLNEVKGWGVKTVRTVVTAMSGTPSVVAGIFIYSMLILTHVLTYSGFAASLALVVILLPSVTRVVEEVLRVVPSGLREASLALGAPEWRTVWSVVLPTARSGVVTAVLLGIARIVGETAPLLFTAFGSQVTNWKGYFNHDQGALPLVIFSDVRQAQDVLINLAFQAAFVLLAIVLVLFVLARIFSRPKGKNGKRRKARPDDDDLMARMFVPIPIEQNEETR
ncbi:MAG: phosphate ABC transporter permease PstA [Acidimicrobiales bacterium]